MNTGDKPLVTNFGMRIDPNANQILIPRNVLDQMRFKQLDTKGHENLLQHIEQLKRKLKSETKMTRELAVDVLKADNEV